MIQPHRFDWSNPIPAGTEIYKAREPRGFVLYCPWIGHGEARWAALVREDVHINAQDEFGTYGVDETLLTPCWQEEVVIR